MSWPIDEDGAPITYVVKEHVLEGRASWSPSNIGQDDGTRLTAHGGMMELTQENLGVVWARGWGTKEANALRTVVALS